MLRKTKITFFGVCKAVMLIFSVFIFYITFGIYLNGGIGFKYEAVSSAHIEYIFFYSKVFLIYIIMIILLIVSFFNSSSKKRNEWDGIAADKKVNNIDPD